MRVHLWWLKFEHNLFSLKFSQMQSRDIKPTLLLPNYRPTEIKAKWILHKYPQCKTALHVWRYGVTLYADIKKQQRGFVKYENERTPFTAVMQEQSQQLIRAKWEHQTRSPETLYMTASWNVIVYFSFSFDLAFDGAVGSRAWSQYGYHTIWQYFFLII